MKGILITSLLYSSQAFSVLPDVQTTYRLSESSSRLGSSKLTQTSSVAAFAGAGPIQVDMNQYNLPYEEIIEEWTASIVPATPLQEEGIYLGAQNAKENLVDTLKVELPRIPGQGLGIELLEIAGGREDGVGITIVEGLVPGGCADGCGLLPGDSLSKIAVKRKSTSAEDELSTLEEIIGNSLECLDWDYTVAAIGSLPPCRDDDEVLEITFKRLRRKPRVLLKLQYPPDMNEPDTTIQLFSGENLRRAMLVRGVKLNDPLSRRFDSGGTGDCGADGTCATCVVAVTQGMDLLGPQGTQEEQMLRKNPRWRLACRTIVGYGMKEGEMTVKVNPRQW